MHVDDNEIGVSVHHSHENTGYELIAIVTAIITVVFTTLLPTLLQGALHQLPFCLMALALVAAAVLAYNHHHTARFWMFIAAAMLISAGGV